MRGQVEGRGHGGVVSLYPGPHGTCCPPEAEPLCPVGPGPPAAGWCLPMVIAWDMGSWAMCQLLVPIKSVVTIKH